MRTATVQDCAGYDCLKSYIDRAEAAYSWTDLGNTLEVPDLGGGGGGGGGVCPQHDLADLDVARPGSVKSLIS